MALKSQRPFDQLVIEVQLLRALLAGCEVDSRPRKTPNFLTSTFSVA